MSAFFVSHPHPAMSSHPPSTSITITLSTAEAAEDLYPPYMVEEDTEKAPAESVTPGLDKHSKRRQPRVLTFYRSISWMLGFRDKYSLFNCERCYSTGSSRLTSSEALSGVELSLGSALQGRWQ
jgi:hypothetical protein